MTTTLTTKGQIVIPKEIREKNGLMPGDDFEIHSGSEAEIVLRKIQRRPNQGLVDLLLACPVKGWTIPARRKEFARKPTL
jgi:AbrB family looped-hinge helix DNA binding protein